MTLLLMLMAASNPVSWLGIIGVSKAGTKKTKEKEREKKEKRKKEMGAERNRQKLRGHHLISLSMSLSFRHSDDVLLIKLNS